MDPNQALADARQAVEDYRNAGSLGMEGDAADRLVEAFTALDEWIVNGGFAPADWPLVGIAR